MFESALGNLCIVICGMTVLLSAFFHLAHGDAAQPADRRCCCGARADLPLADQHDDLPVRGVHLLAHRAVRGRRAALRPALCAHPSLPALRGGERMEYAFTLNVLPVVGGVVIVLVLVLCELGSTGFGGGLPSGGYRYYIGEHTVLYLRQSGTRCRAYVLEGEAPPAVPLHHSRGGTYFKVWAASPAEAELEIEQAYQRRPELEQ